ncbi:MAG: amidohydrolase family protein [Planctomycetales bacterium]|nr:amidohydrolase family protein [Planctomycetales bacterium]
MKRYYCFSNLLCLLLASSASVSLANPEIPGAAQANPIAIVGATIHPISGPAIEKGTIVFSDGKIADLGTRVEIPAGAERIDGSGKHVYPALFDAYSSLGLVEVNAVRASVDTRETGDVNPNVRAHVAVNPDSEVIPVTRSNGVLLAHTAPSGGFIAGKSAVMQLDGWTWEDMTLRPEAGLIVTWPRMSPVSDWYVETSAREQLQQRDETLRKLDQTFELARAYRQAREASQSQQPRDLRWEAMLPVLDGRQPMIVAADEAQQIQAAVAFAQRQSVKLVIYGGYDAEFCADLLKKHDVPVIIAGVYRLPENRSDDYDAPYTLAARLRKAGVRFCISCSERFGASNIRNLPYHAATAVAYGLPADDALRGITLSPAEILGVADRVGSLESGKDATLIVTDGNPLETATQVEAAFVQGRRVELNDRHKRLWKKYEEKYRRQTADE